MPIDNLPRNLRDCREAAGLTQLELANASGMKRECVARLEIGGRARPNCETLERLAVALGVTVDRLLK